MPRSSTAPAPRRSARVVAAAATATIALGCAAPLAGAAAPATGGHTAPTLLGPRATLLQAPANAIYTGVGANGKGTFSLQTNGAGQVVFYDAAWNRDVCGIKNFELFYDPNGEGAIDVDAAGIFVEEYTITYRSGGKRYTVRARDSAQIGLVTGTDGVTRDQATFRERVWVKRQTRGAKWCKGIHKKLFVGDRVSGGA